MADRHRIGTFDKGGRFNLTLDLATVDGSYGPMSGSFKVTAPEQTDVTAKTNRRYGGSRRVAEIHDNGTLQMSQLVKGVSQNDCLAKANAIVALLEDARTTYYWEWRPDGATYSTFYEVRGTAWDPQYNWFKFQGAQLLQMDVTAKIAPLGLGAPLDIWDDFSIDTIAAGDYTFDTGGGTLAGTAGLLVPSDVTEKRLYHSARGYSYTDAQVQLKITPGASVAATHSQGLILKRLDAANFLWASVDDSNAVRIFKRVAGADTQLATAAFTPTVNTSFWLRFRIEGNVVAAEIWTTEPTPAGVTASVLVAYTLSTAEAALFGAAIAGQAGMRLIPKAADWRYDDFRVEPYTYRLKSLPDTLDLRGIPGDAPAKFDARLGVNAVTTQVWTLIGWAIRPAVENRVWNGDFEDPTIGTSGWTSAADPGFIAASAISRVTTASKFGTASMQVVTTAATQSGTEFIVYRTLRKGVTYTWDFWLYSAAATGGITSVAFGQTNGETGAIATTALSSAWTKVTGTYTPTVDQSGVKLVLRQTGSTIQTFNVDGVAFYEGTLAPTIGKHSEGKGAYPPFGLLQAETAIPSTLTAWGIVADGATLGGYYLGNAGTATTLSAEWMVDPTLIAGDDFSTEVSIDVYARFGSIPAAALSVTAALSAVAENNVGARAYTQWGASGKTVVLPSAGTAARDVPLGTITLPVDLANQSRWRLKLTVTATVASFVYLDYLLLVPTRQRACGPTSKANDSTYPAFFHSGTVEEAKTIRSDLSGIYQLPPGPAARDSGISGQLLEFPMPNQGSSTVDAQVLVKTSNLVPDDPTVDATSQTPLSPATSLHFAVQPRYELARSG